MKQVQVRQPSYAILPAQHKHESCCTQCTVNMLSLIDHTQLHSTQLHSTQLNSTTLTRLIHFLNVYKIFSDEEDVVLLWYISSHNVMWKMFPYLITLYKDMVLTSFASTYLEVTEAVVFLAVKFIRIVRTIRDRVTPGVPWNTVSPSAGAIDTFHLICEATKID